MNVLPKVKKAPTQPGVYLMKSSDGKIIYVGKAKNLRNRLKSYFTAKNDHTARIALLVSRISDIEFIITRTELEALMLECTLIKKHHPRYNIHLRDDKTYPYLRISVQEPWPQLSIVRKPKRDQAMYFGPYTSAYSIRETLKLLTTIFPIRDCSQSKFKNRTRPCISFDIGICSAPCVNYVTETQYRQTVDDFISFLKGKNKTILKELKNQMDQLSKNMKYEDAAKMRDRIRGVEHLLEQQRVVSLKLIDQDVIGVFQRDDYIELALLFIRGGRMLGKKVLGFPHVKTDLGTFLSSFMNQYYENEFVPDEIIVSTPLPDQKILENYFHQLANKRVKISVPKGGEKAALLEMAIENAKEAIRGKNLEQKGPNVLEELQKKLHLKNVPDRIECYDISNIQGTNAVGSRVVFIEGERVKEGYRKYKIKTVEGPNDYAMMHEVLSRRFKFKDEDVLPDLLMVDGGRGQLAIAIQVLKELEIEGLDVIGLAKEKTISSFQGKMIEKLQERVYLPGQKNPIIFPETSPALHLLQRVRDEAHRFAVTYHKKLRDKAFLG